MYRRKMKKIMGNLEKAKLDSGPKSDEMKKDEESSSESSSSHDESKEEDN
jgi:hypothetical protein